MSVRESIEKRKPIVIGASIIVILVAGFVIASQMRETLGTPGAGDEYYTNDDGKSYFTAEAGLSPPFDKDGKPAYRAHLFECGGRKVVGYMSRYTPKAQQALAEVKALQGTGKSPSDIGALSSLGSVGTELKRPGEAAWTSAADTAKATQIRVFKCPDGSVPPEVIPGR